MDIASSLWIGLMIVSGVGMLWRLKLTDSKAGLMLLLTLSLMGVGLRGIFQNSKTIAGPCQNNASGSASNVQALQTISEQGVIAVHAPGSQEVIFQHFQTDGAARLQELRPLNGSEWIAIFVSNSAGAPTPKLNGRYLGWFESPMSETPDSLPLVNRYKALGGDIRVEDAVRNETLFVYQNASLYKPVAIVRHTGSSSSVWQVLFSNQPGMLSQKKSTQHTALGYNQNK